MSVLRHIGASIRRKIRQQEIARLFALIDDSERKRVADPLQRFLEHWRDRQAMWTRFPEPADAIAETLIYLGGDPLPRRCDHVGVRRIDAPVRLATVTPGDRGHYLVASTARWAP